MFTQFQQVFYYNNIILAFQLPVKQQYVGQYFQKISKITVKKLGMNSRFAGKVMGKYYLIIYLAQMSVIVFQSYYLYSVNTMLKHYSLRTILIQLALIAIAFSLCLNPAQPDGKCTECSAIEVLINGTCYPKIRGCHKHIAGPKCIECQFGYVLSNDTCIREAVFYNRTNLSYIPPVVINGVKTLSYEDIKTKVGEQYGYLLNDAHDYFITKYTNQLGRAVIKDAQTLPTKTGTYMIIYYQGQKNKYEAVAFTQSVNRVEQVSFSVSGSQKRDPYTADQIVRKTLGDKLKDNILYRFKQQSDIFTIDYISSNFTVTRVQLNRIDLNSTTIANKISTQTLTLSELAFQKFIAQFPNYEQLKITGVKKYDQYYVVSLGSSISFSYRFNNYIFTINKPIDMPQASYFPTEINSTLGSYSDFTDYLDNRLLIGLKLATKQFPQITQAQISKVQSQVVFGTNFYIKLRRPSTNDTYQFLVYVGLDMLAILAQGRKNGVIIYRLDYNYNTDSLFLTNYRIVEGVSKIVNIPGIESVAYKLSNTTRYYKIFYNDNQFSQFTYDTGNKTSNFISYFADGQNLLYRLNSTQAPARRSPEVLMNLIKAQNPQITNTKIISIQQKLPTYIVTLATNVGIYRAEIYDKGDEIVINQFNKVSNFNCFDVAADDKQYQERILMYDDFLKKNYPLADYQIELIQINLQPLSFITRLLYANSAKKQIEIFLEEFDGSANVIKASFINYGYQVVNSDQNSAAYNKMLQVLNRLSLKGSKIPLFVQTNETNIHSYYNDGKSTYQINLDIASDKQSSFPFNTRSYLLLPDGFPIQGILYPTTLSVSDTATLSRVQQEVDKKFGFLLINASLLYASRSGNTVLLMYKSGDKLLRIQNTIGNGNAINVGKFVYYSAKDYQFSNCKSYANTGKCLSCDPNTQSQYQGYCFPKLEGCSIQMGKYCAKCDTKYVKASHQCIKSCENFFK